TALLSCFNSPAPPAIPPLPLHAALPISGLGPDRNGAAHATARDVDEARLGRVFVGDQDPPAVGAERELLRIRAGRHHAQQLALRSEEHTSELQSLTNLVCRLLLEKTKQT